MAFTAAGRGGDGALLGLRRQHRGSQQVHRLRRLRRKCAFDAIHLHRGRPECSAMYACGDKMKAITALADQAGIKIKGRERRAKKTK